MSGIKIIDVILHKTDYGTQTFMVIDRKPNRVYERHGNRLISRDSGFYDCLTIEPGSKNAFAGRKFIIELEGGEQYECNGQVWASHHPDLIGEPTVQVGAETLKELHKCYVFSGQLISKALLDEWLANNKPSRNYSKYDRRETIEYLDEVYAKFPGRDRVVCSARARSLRKRGITIRVNPATGKKGWSPSYELRKAEILRKIAKDNQEED